MARSLVHALLLVLVNSFAVRGQGFGISLSPNAQWAYSGSTVEYEITVTPIGGFSAQVFLSIESTELPSEASFSFSTSIMSSPYSTASILTIDLNEIMPEQQEFQIVVRGENGPIFDLDTVQLALEGPFCYWEEQVDASYEHLGLFIDMDGTKWMYGSFSGVSRFQGSSLMHFNTSNSVIPSNQVRDIAQDLNTGAIWMATSEGLARFDGTFWTVLNTSNSELPCDNLYSVDVGSDGHVWVGTGYCGAPYPGSLYRFDGTTFAEQDLANVLTLVSLSKIKIDHVGRVWTVSRLANGFCNLDMYDGTQWHRVGGEGACFPLRGLKDLAFDGDNVLWIASTGTENSMADPQAGLIKYDGNSWEIWNRNDLTPFNYRKLDIDCGTIVQNNSSTLLKQGLSSVAVTQGGIVWFCSHGQYTGERPDVGLWDGSSFQFWDQTNSVFNGYGRTFVDLDPNDKSWIFYSYDQTLYTRECTFPTGVSSTQTGIGILISPSPSLDLVHIEFPKGSFERLMIFDISGQIVTEKMITGRARVNLDILSFPSGLYRAVAVSADGIISTSFVKM